LQLLGAVAAPQNPGMDQSRPLSPPATVITLHGPRGFNNNQELEIFNKKIKFRVYFISRRKTEL
jgi:hypothetical protein